MTIFTAVGRVIMRIGMKSRSKNCWGIRNDYLYSIVFVTNKAQGKVFRECCCHPFVSIHWRRQGWVRCRMSWRGCWMSCCRRGGHRLSRRWYRIWSNTILHFCWGLLKIVTYRNEMLLTHKWRTNGNCIIKSSIRKTKGEMEIETIRKNVRRYMTIEWTK